MKRLDQTDAYLALCGAASVAVIAVALLSSSLVVDGTVVTNGARSSAPVVSTVPSPPRSDAPAAAPLATVGGGVNSPTVAQTVIASITVVAGETVRGLTYEQWSELAPVFGAQTYAWARIAACETGINPDFRGIDVDGDVIAGAFSVKERFHGAVPIGLHAQSIQVLAIAAKAEAAGVPDPWASTARGCAQWNKNG